MCSCPWERSSNGWLMRTELRIVYVRSIRNLPNSHNIKTSFMPHFGTNEWSCTASNRNHTHLIRHHQQHTVKYWPDSWPPLLLIGNHAWIRLKSMVAAAIIRIMKIACVTYLGALSCLNVILIPRISFHPPFLAKCKVHRPWALFRESKVI